MINEDISFLKEVAVTSEPEKKLVNISEQEKEVYGGDRFRPYFEENENLEEE